ncbi:helix-turn-helix domain-containing protein [Nonomuraea guangzhouensis]|uniref:Helix-turn-helix transcriptional regulator n=1 Tax=Nonomuraea guangzhouensis TaxID=1291555 RepID=A0ABW4GFA4_9ACTN|nr:helix-turn-helix transcriptional regulator [Nonomuraea guangzhouensis]
MGIEVKLDPETSPEARYGYELRERRKAAGLTLAQLGARLALTGQQIGNIERAERHMNEKTARLCEEILGLPQGDLVQHLPRRSRNNVTFRNFLPWLDREKRATELCAYEGLIIPGLLQTREYAEAVCRGMPGITAEQAKEAVEARMQRQAILHRDNPPYLYAVLDQCVLLRPVGSEEITREQLKHLLVMGMNPNIVIQIVPLRAMSTSGVVAGFVIARTAGDGDEAAYIDTPDGGRMVDRVEPVEKLKSWFQTIRADALSRADSLALIGERLEQEWIWN